MSFYGKVWYTIEWREVYMQYKEDTYLYHIYIIKYGGMCKADTVGHKCHLQGSGINFTEFVLDHADLVRLSMFASCY